MKSYVKGTLVKIIPRGQVYGGYGIEAAGDAQIAERLSRWRGSWSLLKVYRNLRKYLDMIRGGFIFQVSGC